MHARTHTHTHTHTLSQGKTTTLIIFKTQINVQIPVHVWQTDNSYHNNFSFHVQYKHLNYYNIVFEFGPRKNIRMNKKSDIQGYPS